MKRIRTHVNSEQVKSLRPCSSCQVCGAVCPTSAIAYRLNRDGFIRPVVDEDKCIACGECMRVCYRYDAELRKKDLSDLTQSTHYAAVTSDQNRLRRSTSGGVAGELIDELIRESYTCAGVEYNLHTDQAEYLLAGNREESEKFVGSKYIQSYVGNVFSTILSACRKKHYAIVGLPCQIYGLDRALRAKGVRDRHVLIDLYCHGCPSRLVWDGYMSCVRSRTISSEIRELRFRTKTGASWGQYRVGLYDAEGVTKFSGKTQKDPFYDLFFSNQLLNDSCSSCLLRGNLTFSDIRLGDFWGDKFVMNSQGVSLVSLNSERGASLFGKIKDRLSLAEMVPLTSFAKHQSLFNGYSVDDSLRDRILSLLRGGGDIESAHQELIDSYGWSKRAGEYLKYLLSLLPYKVTQITKLLYYKLF